MPHFWLLVVSASLQRVVHWSQQFRITTNTKSKKLKVLKTKTKIETTGNIKQVLDYREGVCDIGRLWVVREEPSRLSRGESSRPLIRPSPCIRASSGGLQSVAPWPG